MESGTAIRDDLIAAIAKTKSVTSMHITYVFDIENDSEGEEKVVTDYQAPDRSRAIDAEGGTITIGLDTYRATTSAGPYTHEVLNHGVNALSFLDELGEPTDVQKRVNTYEFKTEATATALVTVVDGLVRVIQITGQSDGYPASTSTWLLTKVNDPTIVIEAPTNVA